MRYSLIFLVTFLAFIWGCSTSNQQELIGKVSFVDWKNSSYWNEESYINYTVDLNKTDLLAEKLDDVNLLYVFASPHCGSCIVEIPRIYKIMEALPKNTEKFQLIVMDEYNTEPSNTYKYYGVNSTPTIIIILKSNKSIKFSPKYDILSALLEKFE